MFVGIGVGIGRQRFSGGFADSYSSRVLADGGTIEALSCVASASTLLQSASLLLIPSGYKAGVAYSALPNNGNGDLTWSRNSTANRTNSSGLIESVGANVPRLDYTYGSCPSALLEPQRTNSFTHSETFANYYTNRTTATDLGTPSIFSSGSMARFTATSSDARFGKLLVLTAGTTYTWSAYFDLSEGIYAGISDTSLNYRIFNLQTGSVVGSGGGTLTITCKSDRVGTTNYYRVAFTFTAQTSANHFFIVGTSSGTNSTTNEKIASGYFQSEQGAYATTYIPTTSANATRLADSYTRNNIYTNGLISASGGTWYVELKNNVEYTRDNTRRFGLSVLGDFEDSISFIGGSNTGLVLQKRIASVNTTLRIISISNVKLAIKWNGTTADVFENGVKVVSATAFTLVNMELLSTQSAGFSVPTFIQAMALFPEPKSDQFCIDLTT